MIALYPINPVYADRILSGEKTFELRRRLPKLGLEYILIYSTSPVAKVVGYAKVKSYLEGDADSLWRKYSSSFGIDESSYFEYFKGCEIAKAIELLDVVTFNRPFPLDDVKPGLVAPQSFCYVEKEIFNRLKRRKSQIVCVRNQ